MKRHIPFIVISLTLLAFLPLLKAGGFTVITSGTYHTPLVPSLTPTPSPIIGYTPIPLASPVVVVAKGQPLAGLNGVSYGLCSPFGNDSNDDESCLTQAFNKGDTLFLSTTQNCTGNGTFTSGSGTYQVSGQNTCCTGPNAGSCSGVYFVNTFTAGPYWFPAFAPAAGRNIRGGNGTVPPDPAVALHYTRTTSDTSIFWIDNNSTVMGLSFRGPNYTTSPTAYPAFGGAGNQGFIFLVGTGTNQNTVIANDDFNGVGGTDGALNIEGSATSSGISIEYNSAENCGYYFIQASVGNGATIAFNKTTDCSCCVEAASTSVTDAHILINDEITHWRFGSFYGETAGSPPGPTAGTQGLWGGQNSSGNPFNYSTNTMENSCCDGSGVNSYLPYIVAGTGNSANCPTLVNNSYAQSCSFINSSGGSSTCPGTASSVTSCTNPF